MCVMLGNASINDYLAKVTERDSPEERYYVNVSIHDENGVSATLRIKGHIGNNSLSNNALQRVCTSLLNCRKNQSRPISADREKLNG